VTAEAVGSRIGTTDNRTLVPAQRDGSARQGAAAVRAPEHGTHGSHRTLPRGRVTALAPPAAAVLVALVVAVAAGVAPATGLAVVGTWLVHHLATARSRVLVTGRAPADVLHRAAWPFVAASLGVLPGWLPASDLAPALATSVAATVVLTAGTTLVRRRAPLPRVLVVGDPPAAQELLRQWNPRADLVTLGRCPLDDRLPGTVRRARVDAVVLAPSPRLDADAVRRLCWALEGSGTAVALAPPLGTEAPHRLTPGRLGGRSLIEVAPSRPRGVDRLAKATLDRAGAALLLCVTGPLLLGLLLLVRLDSPGNPVFTQVRVGRHGQLFRIYKIRTMCDDAEGRKRRLADRDEGNGVLFKMHHDPRVTRVGRVLRRTSLDELPQLLNVLRGEMSLVGPRPALPGEVAAYDDVARRRLAVRPGLTGLWQVSGRSDLDWETSVALDVAYTDNVTLGEDLRICARTLGAVVHGHGAY